MIAQNMWSLLNFNVCIMFISYMIGPAQIVHSKKKKKSCEINGKCFQMHVHLFCMNNWLNDRNRGSVINLISN